MTAFKVENPFEYFSDTNGHTLEGGKIYIGTYGLDAETNQIPVFFDAEETTPATQPLTTTEGYPSNGGSAVTIFTEGRYSITVRDKNDVLVYSERNVTSLSSRVDAVEAVTELTFPTAADFFANTRIGTGDLEDGTIITAEAEGISWTVDQVSTNPDTTVNGVKYRANEIVTSGYVARSFDIDPSNANNHAGIMQAIDRLDTAGGGDLTLPRGSFNVSGDVDLPDSCALDGQNRQESYRLSTGFVPTTGITLAAGSKITASGDRTNVSGIAFNLDAASTEPALLVNGNGGSYEKLTFNGGMSSQLVLTAASGGCTLASIITLNGLTGRAGLSAHAGSVDVSGDDHFLYGIEAGCQSGFTTVTNGFAVGLRMNGVNCMMSDCIGEFGEIGMLISGDRNRITGSRADRCMGDGWVISGGSNTISATHAIQCGTAAADTYDGYRITGTHNRLMGPIVERQGGPRLLRGIADELSSNTAQNEIHGPKCADGDAQTPFFNNSFLGGAFAFGSSAKRITTATATPNVSGRSLVQLAFGSAATVTSFVGGVNGQKITFLGNTSATIANNAVIKTKTGSDVTFSSAVSRTFTNYNGVWFEDQ